MAVKSRKIQPNSGLEVVSAASASRAIETDHADALFLVMSGAGATATIEMLIESASTWVPIRREDGTNVAYTLDAISRGYTLDFPVPKTIRVAASGAAVTLGVIDFVRQVG